MKDERRALQWLAWSMLMLVLTGCSTLKQLESLVRLQEPEVELEDIRVTALSLESVTLELVLGVNNPNPAALTLAGADYSLKINGQPLVAGTTRESLSLVARGRSPVVVPVTFEFEALKTIATELWHKDEVSYLAEARVRVDMPLVGMREFSAQRQGALPVPKPPRLRIRDFKVESLGFRGAELSVALEVDNHNSFAIDIKGLDYSLVVAEAPWAKGALTRAVHLPAKSVQEVRIPVKLSFMEAGASVMNAVNKGAAMNYLLTGSVQLDTSLPLLKNLNLPIHHAGQMGASQ